MCCCLNRSRTIVIFLIKKKEKFATQTPKKTDYCNRLHDTLSASERPRGKPFTDCSAEKREHPTETEDFSRTARAGSIQFGAIQLFKHTCLVEAFPGPRRVAWAAPFSSPFREHGPEHAGALYIVMYFLLGTADNSEPGGDEGGGSWPEGFRWVTVSSSLRNYRDRN